MLSQTENKTVPVCAILSCIQPVYADGQLSDGIKYSLGKEQQQCSMVFYTVWVLQAFCGKGHVHLLLHEEACTDTLTLAYFAGGFGE